MLAGLVADHPHVRLDLAWLYERSGRPAPAEVERHLALEPGNEAARSQQRRLRAQLLAPGALVEEVDSLRDLGEAVALETLPAYVRGLLESGQGAEARHFVEEQEASWPTRTAAAVGWQCYRLQAYDLALRLFLRVLGEQCDDFKLLAALEAAARQCDRVADVVRAYEPLAPAAKHLYGRLRALRARAQQGKK